MIFGKSEITATVYRTRANFAIELKLHIKVVPER